MMDLYIVPHNYCIICCNEIDIQNVDNSNNNRLSAIISLFNLNEFVAINKRNVDLTALQKDNISLNCSYCQKMIEGGESLIDKIQKLQSELDEVKTKLNYELQNSFSIRDNENKFNCESIRNFRNLILNSLGIEIELKQFVPEEQDQEILSSSAPDDNYPNSPHSIGSTHFSQISDTEEPEEVIINVKFEDDGSIVSDSLLIHENGRRSQRIKRPSKKVIEGDSKYNYKTLKGGKIKKERKTYNKKINKITAEDDQNMGDTLENISEDNEEKSQEPTEKKSKIKLKNCQYCPRAFDKKIRLTEHMREHKNEYPLSCTLCQASFSRKFNLRNHIATKHPHLAPVHCTICLKGFLTNYLLKKHMTCHEVEKKFKCLICDKLFKTESNLKLHHQSHEQKVLCHLCAKSFDHHYTLKAHIKAVHCKEYNFKCNVEQCTFVTSSKSLLKSHIFYVHENVKNFQCDSCGNSYKNMFRLREHTRSQHSNLRPFKCETCSKSFARKILWKKHQLIHSSERPYQCSICNKGFVAKNFLQLHNKHYHSGRIRIPRKKKDIQQQNILIEDLQSIPELVVVPIL